MKTIYQRWFIEFEFPNEEGKPYKSSGGKFVYNNELKQEIPENWQVYKLKDLVSENREAFESEEETNTIDLSVMPSNSISLNDINSNKNFSTNLFKMHRGDVLFGGIRTYLKKAGVAPCDGAFAGTVYSYSPIKEFDYNLILLTIISKSFFKYSEQISKGTKMPVASSKDLMEYKIAYSKEIAYKFNEIIDLKNVISQNVMENLELKKLKNFLLPLLMNGQINVDDIEI